MVNELTRLYNTLMLIETKGENTKLMGQCLTFTAALINKAKADAETAKVEKASEEGDA